MQPLLILVRLVRPHRQPHRPPDAPRVGTDEDEYTPVPGPQAANEPFAVLPAVGRVTATELWNAYDVNEADAERRFAHRPLYVSGPVERVSREGSVFIVHFSVSGTPAASVGCQTRNDQRVSVERLRRGDLVMVVGERVFKASGQVVVDGCRLVEDDLTASPLPGRR